VERDILNDKIPYIEDIFIPLSPDSSLHVYHIMNIAESSFGASAGKTAAVTFGTKGILSNVE
jgi:hypothetical protein